MGLQDSSRTRVAPIFNRLVARDPTGATWLRPLLELPERPDGHRPTLPGELGSLTDFAWHGLHAGERRLDPPVALLRSLIETPCVKAPPADYGTRDQRKRELRRKLFARDHGTVQDALAALAERGFVEHEWYVFEGRTAVDAYLATPELVVLLEGKRTERAPTTKTQWMPVRHQLLRSLDAMWDLRGLRQLIALFIVEGKPPDQSDVPARWIVFANETVSANALAASLPHRSADERRSIADCFAGVTTWQAVCEQLEIPWSEIDESPG